MALNESKLQFCSQKMHRGLRGLAIECCRKASVERDGTWFCKQHDPVAVLERRRASEERWEAKNAEYIRASRLSRAAPELLEALKTLVAYCELVARDEGPVPESQLIRARAAIAKAEGK